MSNRAIVEHLEQMNRAIVEYPEQMVGKYICASGICNAFYKTADSSTTLQMSNRVIVEHPEQFDKKNLYNSIISSSPKGKTKQSQLVLVLDNHNGWD
jgi:predicted transcriptional regulator